MKTVEIEKALMNIDPISFERMIGDMVPYICKLKTSNSTHIEKIGVKHGEMRTIKGTPDIFIVSDTQNIAVQCSVDKKIEQKIYNDIEKCIKEFSKKDLVLNKIVFCCNRNIKIELINKIKEELSKNDIAFEFVGLDDLTEIIYLQSPFIANDYLDVKFSDGTLKTLSSYKESKSYKEEHNCSFYYRDEDKIQLLSKISKGSVIVYGKAGDGKTRFVLEVAEQWKQQSNKREVFILNNNSFDISNDFSRMLANTEVEYLLLIDDINRLSIFDRVLSFIKEKDNVKIVATVRDYALKSITTVYGSLFDKFELKPLTNEEIKNIIQKEYEIRQHKYLEYILSVSKGNLRFAILASKTILQKPDSFPQIKDILENHFTKIFKDINEVIFMRNENLIKTLGILSFFQKLYLNDKDETLLNKILTTFKLKKEDFLYAISYWDSKEIIKLIYDANIAVMEDQILRTYLFNYVFIEKKILNLKDLLINFLSTHRGNIVDSINSINYVYGSNLYLINEINECQKLLFKNRDPLLYTYLAALALANPMESLEIIDTQLKNGEKEYLDLLINFLETDYYNEAINLIFRELEKSEYNDKEAIEKIIIKNFIVNTKSFDNEYITQIEMLKHLKSLEGYINLKIKVFEEHCKFCFEATESNYRNFTFYRIPLGWNKGVENYRKILWEIIDDVYAKCEYEDLGKLSKAITNYTINNSAKKTEELEYCLINNFVTKIKEKDINHLAFKYNLLKYYQKLNKKVFSTKKIKDKSLTIELLDIQESALYANPEKNNELVKKLKNLTKQQTYKLIRELKQISDIFESSKKTSEDIICQFLELNNYLGFSRFELIKYLNLKFASIYIYSDKFISLLIKENGFNKIKLFFEKSHFDFKWNYLFSTFTFIDKVDENIYFDCLKLFSNSYDIKVIRGTDRITRLNKFYEYDPNFYINATKKLLNGGNTNLCFIFSTIFDEEKSNNSIEKYYKNEKDILIKLYFKLLSIKSYIDYDKKFINYIINIDKKYLKEYIKCANQIDIKFLWEREDWKSLILYLCDYLLDDKILSRFDIEHVLSCGTKEKSIEILKNLMLKYINNKEKLFEIMTVVEEYQYDIQKELVIFLMKNKCDKEILLRIPIASGPHAWSGSRIPYIEKNFKLLEEIHKELYKNGLLAYEPVINQFIQWNRKQLLRTQIEEYNEGYF